MIFRYEGCIVSANQNNLGFASRKVEEEKKITAEKKWC